MPDIPDPEAWMPPDDLKFTCDLCGSIIAGMEGVTRHLVDDHGYDEPERWPDGGLVLDTSALLEGDTDA